MKKIIFIIIAFLTNFSLYSQIKTTIFSVGNAFQEFPMLNQINKEEIPLYETSSFNLDSIIKKELFNAFNFKANILI